MIHENYSQIFILGPEGTFSDEAAKAICTDFSQLTYTKTIASTLKHVVQYPDSVAVIPIENSVAGVIDQVQDLLVSHELVILQEINIPIRYTVLANADLDQITLCYAHPQASEQTINFIGQNFPEAEILFTNSNADSGIQFLKAQRKKKTVAAIIPYTLTEKYAEFVVNRDKQTNVQDYENNTTRFIVVRKSRGTEAFDFGRKKTSLFIELNEDHSGMLFDLLKIFKEYEINLCRLESRPSKKVPWVYVFYVDFHNNQNTKACLASLNASFFIHKVLGSYDVLT
ncbi:prephenate dehydratase domain-containing protein [Deltaproteobacteria bacterium TL4]